MDLLAFAFVDYLRLWMNDNNVYLHLWTTCMVIVIYVMYVMVIVIYVLSLMVIVIYM